MIEAITNTGATAINGDIGTFSGTAVTGIGEIALTGTDHGGDALTRAAHASVLTAFNAAAADKAVAAGKKLGPLHGVPFSIKDAIDTAGVPTQGGSKIFEGRIPEKDATSVARMKNAGAIPLMKTNIPEFSAHWESENLLTGRTLNPWNPDRTPGGSSGGDVHGLGRT